LRLGKQRRVLSPSAIKTPGLALDRRT